MEENTLADDKRYDIEEVQGACLQIIGEHLKEKKHTGDKVDYALRGLSAVGRLKATERAKDATQAAVIHGMSEDKNEFKKYVAVSLPHLNPIALLGEKKK